MNMQPEPNNSETVHTKKVEVSVSLDPELMDQIQHLTNDPSKVIEVAIRQWLRGDVPRDDELTRTPRRIPVPPRGEWND
ncbi:ribbon-helix-helix domain-containing protein [Okeanomitos corallinicola TIOX110]|uniref:Ribbon-helix-helix domain-containing protein n=1 Tax=Okeanomitos corallinicola TIOX110 TaxID=3133117 RepID=A0ABZ2UR13_9CYAN